MQTKDKRTLADLVGEVGDDLPKSALGADILKRLKTMGLSKFEDSDVLAQNALIEIHGKSLSSERKNRLLDELITLSLMPAESMSPDNVILSCRDRIAVAIKASINSEVSKYVRKVKSRDSMRAKRLAKKKNLSAMEGSFLTVAA
jgi:hypothetical protein